MFTVEKILFIIRNTSSIFITKDEIEDFISKIDIQEIDQCWEWIAGKKGKEGYGGFYTKYKDNTMNCHKIMFLVYHNFQINDIPKNLCIRHDCNNPKCVNPTHLIIGTHKDNSQDMVKAGHSLIGIKNPKSRLTNEQVKDIRNLWDSGKYNQYQIADLYNVGQGTIAKIVNNIGYRDPNYIIKKHNHSVKYSINDIKEIRRLYNNKLMSSLQIMEKFKIKQSQFYNIIHNRQRKEDYDNELYSNPLS